MALTQQPSQRNFLVGGSETIPLVANVTTDIMSLVGITVGFSIQAVNVLGLSDETVTYTIEASMDGVTFYPYKPTFYEDVALKGLNSDDTIAGLLYFRLVISINDNTTGSAEFLIGGFK